MFSLKIDKRAKEYKIKSNRKAFLADNYLFKKFDILEKEIFKFERQTIAWKIYKNYGFDFTGSKKRTRKAGAIKIL